MGPSAFGQLAQTENKGKGTDRQLFCTLTEANQKEEQEKKYVAYGNTAACRKDSRRWCEFQQYQ
jgi:hypothetical protein